MYFLDKDMNYKEANATTVYRVFGGDSSLEGGYVTCEAPVNPIQARCDLALSQHDFVDDEGIPVRNLASKAATGTVFTDDEDRIINPLTGQVTDNTLQFSDVEPSSDMPGGGLEYHLEDDFYNVVQVDSVDELRHQPTEGWTNYVDIESEVLLNTESDEVVETEISTDSQAIDSLLDDEEFEIQSSDTNVAVYGDAGWSDPDDDGRDDRSLDDEWYIDSGHTEESLDALIDDEIYDAQASDVEKSWMGTNDYTDVYESENDISNNDY